MTKILFAYESNIPTVTTTREMFKVGCLSAYDIDVEFKRLNDMTAKDIDGCDVLWLIRPENTLAASIARKAKKRGCFIITSCDDDLLHLPKSLPRIPWRKKALVKTLSLSNIVCSPNQKLCEKYAGSTIGKRGVVIHSAVDPTQIHFRKPSDDSGDLVRIVYAAGANHEALFNRFVLPAIELLPDEVQKNISLTFVGVKPDLTKYKDRIRTTYVDSMPLSEYRDFMKREEFDIGLAPLEDNEFSKYKYFNKFIEYTMVGTVGIYSNVEPFTFIVKDKANGFLADNTPQGWYEALMSAVHSRETRNECLTAAQSELENDFNSEAIMRKLVEDIPELKNSAPHTSKTGSLSACKIKYKFFRFFDLIYLSCFYLMHGGVKGFVRKFKSHRKDKKAVNKEQ